MEILSVRLGPNKAGAILVSVCERLPESWNNVVTETEFPVDTGTTITVSCQEGYFNTGSKVVTCNTELYQDFKYENVPSCIKPSKSTSLSI